MRFDRETDVVYAIILDRFGQVVAHSRAPSAVGSTPSDAVSLRALSRGARCSRRRPGRTGRRSTTSRCRSWSRARAGAPCASASRASAWTPRSRGPAGSWPALAVVALVLGGLATASSRGASPGPSASSPTASPRSRAGSWTSASSRGRSDELGRLALAFNEMAAQLRQQRTDLEVGRRRAAPALRGAVRPEELHRPHPPVLRERARHARSRRARGHGEPGRRAPHRVRREPR